MPNISKRNSSVELFRIIATFLVIIVHLNGWFVSMPKYFTQWTPFTVGQSLIESFSIICVNSFLVITGWYGIKFKVKHLWKIYLVVAWMYVTSYIFQCFTTHSFSVFSLLWNIIAVGKESYYIQCYMLLIIFAPVLNSFIEQYGRTGLKYVIAIWIAETLLDFGVNNKSLGFAHGFEFTHFVLMYLLGQMAFLYQDLIFKYLNRKRSLLLTGICFSAIWIGYIFINKRVFAYSNPANIIMSFSLFFFFVQKKFQNKAIDWISSSTLMVYLFHLAYPIQDWLREIDTNILMSHSYASYLCIMGTVTVSVFAMGVLYDKIRIVVFKCITYLWNRLSIALNL